MTGEEIFYYIVCLILTFMGGFMLGLVKKPYLKKFKYDDWYFECDSKDPKDWFVVNGKENVKKHMELLKRRKNGTKKI